MCGRGQSRRAHRHGNGVGIVSVVVGMDGSEPSDHALCFAVGLAAREHARVNVCFVSHQPPTFGINVPPVDFDSYAKELELRANEELDRADVGGSFYHRQGDVVIELKRLADERVADLIAVGRSRHPHLHVGSVPRRLLDISGHAVLIVP
jgi:nucleotide-binding universal stress UspA family protein